MSANVSFQWLHSLEDVVQIRVTQSNYDDYLIRHWWVKELTGIECKKNNENVYKPLSAIFLEEILIDACHSCFSR